MSPFDMSNWIIVPIVVALAAWLGHLAGTDSCRIDTDPSEAS
jgi:hypothetical protein